MAVMANTCTGKGTPVLVLEAASLLLLLRSTATLRSARKSSAVGCSPARTCAASQGPSLIRRQRWPTGRTEDRFGALGHPAPPRRPLGPGRSRDHRAPT